MTEQHTLAELLPPLKLRDWVRLPDGTTAQITQVWPGRDWHGVFNWDFTSDFWKGRSFWASLPTFRRDELELV